MTDGGGRREGEREGGQWDPSFSSLPPSTSSKTIVIRFISLIRFSLSAEGEKRENHASEATLCLASHTGPGSVSVLTSKLGMSLIRKSKDCQ